MIKLSEHRISIRGAITKKIRRSDTGSDTYRALDLFDTSRPRPAAPWYIMANH